MPGFQVEKSIVINAPASKVRSVIQDYHQWAVWSPWLCMEPDAKLAFEGTASTTGHAYSWEGDMVGAGRMELAEITDHAEHMDLAFIRPFKSTAKVRFETTATDASQSRVTWTMDSSLPFFLFFMVGTMISMIGMDYDRGLKLLKEYVETGAVTSRTEIVGVVDVPAIPYAGISADTPLASISQSMQKTIPEMMDLTNGKTTDTFCGAIYHNMNIKAQHCDYTVFAPVHESDATGQLPQGRALKVIHTGSYQHLGNAWSTINNYQRHKKIKLNKQAAPYELYVNDPEQVDAAELVTEIYMPVNA